MAKCMVLDIYSTELQNCFLVVLTKSEALATDSAMTENVHQVAPNRTVYRKI